jgi:hypothetical protein
MNFQGFFSAKVAFFVENAKKGMFIKINIALEIALCIKNGIASILLSPK